MEEVVREPGLLVEEDQGAEIRLLIRATALPVLVESIAMGMVVRARQRGFVALGFRNEGLIAHSRLVSWVVCTGQVGDRVYVASRSFYSERNCTKSNAARAQSGCIAEGRGSTCAEESGLGEPVSDGFPAHLPGKRHLRRRHCAGEGGLHPGAM